MDVSRLTFSGGNPLDYNKNYLSYSGLCFLRFVFFKFIISFWKRAIKSECVPKQLLISCIFVHLLVKRFHVAWLFVDVGWPSLTPPPPSPPPPPICSDIYGYMSCCTRHFFLLQNIILWSFCVEFYQTKEIQQDNSECIVT